MSIDPLVSVVLATFDRLNYLRPAIDSVFAQTFDNWELIVADDGSGEETSRYLETIGANPRVRVLRLTHTGNPSRVRNAALKESRGQYVAFMDSDDVWLPDKLDRQLGSQRASRCRWSYTALLRANDCGEVLASEYPGRRAVPAGSILKQLLTLEVAIATAAVMVERDLLVEVGGFDDQQLFFEEYDLWLRLNLRSEVCAIAEPLVLVRNHDQHYSADRIGAYQARLRLLDKFTDMAAREDLGEVVRCERAKSAAALAAVLAARGQGMEALRMLWQSRTCALRNRRWWRQAAATVGRAMAPAWLRTVVRNHRARGRSSASGRPGPVPRT
jgi:glycosyltransferase involved in cell wall biosynthesis